MLKNPFYLKTNGRWEMMAVAYPTAIAAQEMANLSVIKYHDSTNAKVYDCEKSGNGVLIFEIEKIGKDKYIFRYSDSEEFQMMELSEPKSQKYLDWLAQKNKSQKGGEDE